MMRFVAWILIMFVLTFSLTRVAVIACSGEVEMETGANKYGWKNAYKLPIDYQNTVECKCCGGTGRIQKISQSR